jgi:hypothetical protein
MALLIIRRINSIHSFLLKHFITLNGVNIFPNGSSCLNKEYVKTILHPNRKETAEIASVMLMNNNSEDIAKKYPSRITSTITGEQGNDAYAKASLTINYAKYKAARPCESLCMVLL